MMKLQKRGRSKGGRKPGGNEVQEEPVFNGRQGTDLRRCQSVYTPARALIVVWGYLGLRRWLIIFAEKGLRGDREISLGGHGAGTARCACKAGAICYNTGTQQTPSG